MKFRACFNSEGGSGKSLNTPQAIFVLGKTTAHAVIKIANITRLSCLVPIPGRGHCKLNGPTSYRTRAGTRRRIWPVAKGQPPSFASIFLTNFPCPQLPPSKQPNLHQRLQIVEVLKFKNPSLTN